MRRCHPLVRASIPGNIGGRMVRAGKVLTIILAAMFVFLLADHLIYGGRTMHAGLSVVEPRAPGQLVDFSAKHPSEKIAASVLRDLIKEDPGSFLGTGTISMALANLSITEAQGLLHGQMVKREYDCKTVARFGKAGDGGYEVCMDDYIKPKTGDCLVYSFGINDDWSFDDGINAKLNCEVHSFDPSINMKDHMHKPNMYFYNLGIWGSTLVNKANWQLKALSTIIKDLKHTNRTIDYVKLDVEGAEFPALRDIIDSGVYSQIKQISMEVHAPRLRNEKEAMSLLDYAEMYMSFHDLEQRGFRKFLHESKDGCCFRFSDLTPQSIGGKMFCCYEIFYVNVNFFPKV